MIRPKPLPLLLVLFAFEIVLAQQVGVRLPEDLSEEETQLILKERKPKSHVEATFKISDTRLSTALQQARSQQYTESAQNLDIYAALVSYADSYARRETPDQSKDRSQCLKVIEQRIFKQTALLDSIYHELPYTYRETSSRAVEVTKKMRLRALDDLLGGGAFLKSASEPQD